MAVEQHTHGEYVTRKEINGLGGRLNDTEKEQEGIRVKTERNEQDIQAVTKLIEQNARVAASFKDTVQGEVALIRQSLTGLTIRVGLLSAGLSTAVVLAIRYFAE